MMIRVSLFVLALAACGDDAATPTGDATEVSFEEVFVPDGDTVDTRDTADSTPSDTLDATDTRDTADTDDAADTTSPDTTDTTDTTSPDTTDTTSPDTTDTADTTDSADTAPDTAADTTPADTAADTTPADTADTAADSETVGECTGSGYTSVAADALKFGNGDLWYLAQSNTGGPVDVFSVEIYAELGGAQAPGTYELSEQNYDTCPNCVLLQLQCDENLNNCARTFLAVSGTMRVDAFGDIGDPFAAHFQDLVLREITYDSDFHSTFVPGGYTWCIDSYDANTTIQ